MGEDIQLDGALHETEVPGLSCITSGNLPPNPAELLGSNRMYQIISKIMEESDITILDTPPLLAVTDAVILSKHVEGVLLIIEPGNTKVTAAQKAVEQLRRVGANLIGVVINNIEVSGSRYSYYYYYYADDYYGNQRRRRKKKSKE